jgi:ankyrin repeat protein
MTPLLYAAWVGQNPAIASALLQAGANPNARSATGRGLMEYAENNPVIAKDATVMQQLEESIKSSRASAQRVQLHG